MGDHCRTRDGEDDRSDRISPTNASHRLVEKDFGFGELTAKLSGLTPEGFATTL
jgi:hypothetical protein